jgi:hypothetical protein
MVKEEQVSETTKVRQRVDAALVTMIYVVNDSLLDRISFHHTTS